MPSFRPRRKPGKGRAARLRQVELVHAGLLQLQRGHYDHRVDRVTGDEVGALADAVNTLADRLREDRVALTRQAVRDALTGLPNREALAERLGRSFSGVDRRRRHEALLFIDVDDFKVVNDTLGHDVGDELLVELARRLTSCVRSEDLVVRLGGDEFAIVIVGTDGEMATLRIAERILAALREPFVVNEARLHVAVSIGIAHREPTTAGAAELMRQADFAMYMAKGGGKGRFEVFDSSMHDKLMTRSAIKAELAGVVASGQLRLEYQPVANLGTGEVIGVEALVRWQHPTLGYLGPREFIPLAEETGDITAIGCWVLRTAAVQVAAWRRAFERAGDLWVAVNLSAFHLPGSDARAAVERILADPAVEADKVVLEVTEAAIAANLMSGAESLRAWKRHGARIAIDDFGTGFSSLSTLAGLPVDILKVDRSFVSGPGSTEGSVPSSLPMLDGILGLAEKLSLEVIAEGIETIEQIDVLRQRGCFEGQGFYLAPPTPPARLEILLAAGGMLRVPESVAV